MLNKNYEFECDNPYELQKRNQDEEKNVVETNVVRAEDDRNVLVRLFGDKTVAITFNNNDTVGSVKKKIQDICGYPAKFIQLKVGARTIYNDYAIMSQFNIANDDIVHAVTYNTRTSKQYHVLPTQEYVLIHVATFNYP